MKQEGACSEPNFPYWGAKFSFIVGCGDKSYSAFCFKVSMLIILFCLQRGNAA